MIHNCNVNTWDVCSHNSSQDQLIEVVVMNESNKQQEQQQQEEGENTDNNQQQKPDFKEMRIRASVRHLVELFSFLSGYWWLSLHMGAESPQGKYRLLSPMQKFHENFSCYTP